MKFCSTYLWEKGHEQVHNPVSLVLQQVEVRKQSVLFACVCRGVTEEGCGVSGTEQCGAAEEGCGVLGTEQCGAAEEGRDAVEISGYFTEALVEWFHREGVELVEQKRSDAEVERCLKKEIRVVMEEVFGYGKTKAGEASMDCVGMLLVEQRFWMFSKGKGRVFLLNRRYNQKHMRCILGRSASQNTGDSLSWEKGILQKKLGLLLCMDDFGGELDEKAVAEALLVEGRIEEERVQRRLKEVWDMKRDCRKREFMENGKADWKADVGVVYFMTY